MDRERLRSSSKTFYQYGRLSFKVIIFLLLNLGCTSLHYSLKSECQKEHCFQIPNVPFVEQKENYCGPASLAMVMSFYGANLSQEEIAEEIYEPEIEGTLSIQLVLYPIRKGFEAEIYNGGIEDMKKKIKGRFPLIVSIKSAETERNHYMVIWGFDELNRRIFAHSGREKEISIDYEVFQDMWRRADYLTVWIYPKILQSD